MESRRAAIVEVMALAILIACLALSWCPRTPWRLLSLVASAGACSSVVLGLLVEPHLATRLWGTLFAPVALVTSDPQAQLTSSPQEADDLSGRVVTSPGDAGVSFWQ